MRACDRGPGLGVVCIFVVFVVTAPLLFLRRITSSAPAPVASTTQAEGSGTTTMPAGIPKPVMSAAFTIAPDLVYSPIVPPKAVVTNRSPPDTAMQVAAVAGLTHSASSKATLQSEKAVAFWFVTRFITTPLRWMFVAIPSVNASKSRAIPKCEKRCTVARRIQKFCRIPGEPVPRTGKNQEGAGVCPHRAGRIATRLPCACMAASC